MKPGRGSKQCVPRPTHQWLAPLFTYLDYGAEVVAGTGASGIPNAVWAGRQVAYTQLGNASGVVGFYGSTGVAGQVASGTAGTTGFTGIGAASGAAWWYHGGSGTFYTVADVVLALKNVGILKP